MKKLLIKSVSLLLLAVLVTSTSAYAAVTPYKIGSMVQIGKYKGQIISMKDLPKGITPLKVNSLEEAEQVMNQMENAFKNSIAPSSNNVANSQNLEMNYLEQSSVQPLAAVTTISGTQDKINGSPGLGYQFHVTVNYTYCTTYSGYAFLSCDYINSYLTGNGVTFTEWTQTNSSSAITYGGRILNATTVGYLTNYLITPVGLVPFRGDVQSIVTEFTL